MADKRLRLIVEAVTSEAERNLKSLANEIRRLGDQGAKGAGDLSNLQQRAARLLRETQELGKGAGDLRREMEADTQGLSLWSAAAEAATDAAVMLGAGWAGLALADKVLDLARSAALAEGVADSFDTLAQRSQMDSDRLLDSLDKAAKGTVSDLDLMKGANAAWYLGISQNVDQYTGLMKIAEEKSKDFGISTSEYWGRLTTALASGYPMSARQLGIVIDNDVAYRNYATSIGKAADELNDQEQIQARVQAVLADSEPVLRDWEQAEIAATTTTQQFDASMANLRDTIKEGLLPVLLPAIEWINKGLEGNKEGIEGQNAAIAQLIKETGSAAAAEAEFARRIEIASQGMIDGAEATRQAHLAMVDYRIALLGIDKGIQEDVRAMRMAQQAMIDWGTTTEAVTEDQQKALEKSQDIWGNYLRDVSEENWRYAQRYEDMQFSMQQSAERALFDLMKTEREAADRRGDLLESADIRIEADSARHSMKLKDIAQDLADDLMDTEWDYQRDRSEAVKKAPWWIRQALSKEYQERERIAGTGDARALKDYDAMLLERIRAIDPVYAQELELLQDQYEHKEDIDRREAGQSLQREQESWSISNREQERGLDQQLRELDRQLGYQREEWAFHQAQREESERWSMNNLVVEHEHSLGKLYDDTQRKLGDLVPVYEHYGYSNWVAFFQGWNAGQTDYPLTIGGANKTEGPSLKGYQRGLEYVPQTMPVMVHKGEMVLPAAAAQQMREGLGGATIIIQKLIVGSGRAGAQEFLNAVNQELGSSVARRSR